MVTTLNAVVLCFARFQICSCSLLWIYNHHPWSVRREYIVTATILEVSEDSITLQHLAWSIRREYIVTTTIFEISEDNISFNVFRSLLLSTSHRLQTLWFSRHQVIFAVKFPLRFRSKFQVIWPFMFSIPYILHRKTVVMPIGWPNQNRVALVQFYPQLTTCKVSRAFSFLTPSNFVPDNKHLRCCLQLIERILWKNREFKISKQERSLPNIDRIVTVIITHIWKTARLHLAFFDGVTTVFDEDVIYDRPRAKWNSNYRCTHVN